MPTYKELARKISFFTEEQLNADVCIYDSTTDEHYQKGVELVFATEKCSVLDTDHPVIQF